FIAEEAPAALERTLGGIRRVSDIVAALKRFAHPGGDELVAVDLEEVVRTALTVSRSEWKYVAEVVEDYGSVPYVRGSAGELGQVVLNLVVNAAHAIDAAREQRGDASGELGTITVRTSQTEDLVVLEISDSGCGIPDDVRERMYDPFFTTKEVGKGTGQGLAIAHSVIVERHGGTIDVESVLGEGTTFRICLAPACLGRTDEVPR
ncbi:MAG: hypothetical protein KDB21_16425, partial [Acidimicrobiales bacterium]|nr:hypothetical protein [Acidimicrobiales bacterium]